MNFKALLRVWVLPLLGISMMLLLGLWSEVASYFLFTHHLFWIIGVILLINPVAQMLPPGPAQKGEARPQTGKHKPRVEQKPALVAEMPAERLARLQQQKKAIDQIIEQSSTRKKKDR